MFDKMAYDICILNELLESDGDDSLDELEVLKRRMSENISSASSLFADTKRGLDRSDADIDALINSELGEYTGSDNKVGINISGIPSAESLASLLSGNPNDLINKAMGMLLKGSSLSGVDGLLDKASDVISGFLTGPKDKGQKFKVPKGLISSLAKEVKGGKYNDFIKAITDMSKSVYMTAKTQLMSLAPIERKPALKKITSVFNKLGMFVKVIKLRSKFVKDTVVPDENGRRKANTISRYTSEPMILLNSADTEELFLVVDISAVL